MSMRISEALAHESGRAVPPSAPAAPAVTTTDGSGDALETLVDTACQSLQRRGYLTTEWWTTIVGGLLSVVLSAVHLGSSTSLHWAGIVAPTLVAVIYTALRTLHKTALTKMVSTIVDAPSARPTGQ
jgi:hypothetical protein